MVSEALSRGLAFGFTGHDAPRATRARHARPTPAARRFPIVSGGAGPAGGPAFHRSALPLSVLHGLGSAPSTDPPSRPARHGPVRAAASHPRIAADAGFWPW